MRARIEAFTIPAHADYFTASIPGLGELPLVEMRFADRERWQDEFNRAHVRYQAKEIGGAAQLALIWSLYAAVVGLGWAHPTQELVTSPADHPSLREYGAAVIAELECSHLPIDIICALGKRASETQIQALAEIGEAAAALPFSRVRRGGGDSSSSAPVQSIAKTRGRTKG